MTSINLYQKICNIMIYKYIMVPKERLELSLCFQNRILNPARLPVPPLRRGWVFNSKAQIIAALVHQGQWFQRIVRLSEFA
jgi:hypothetical protein